MSNYVINPDEWWNDCGTWRYDDEAREFSVTVLDNGDGFIRLGGYSTTYSGDIDSYVDPTAEEQRFTSWGYILAPIRKTEFYDEDGQPRMTVNVSNSFIKQMEAFCDADDKADWAAVYFAEWCRNNGGRSYKTDTDAYADVCYWLKNVAPEVDNGAEPWSSEAEPWALIHFLFECGHETEAEAHAAA